MRSICSIATSRSLSLLGRRLYLTTSGSLGAAKWACTAEVAKNEIFNIANGGVCEKNAWPAIVSKYKPCVQTGLLEIITNGKTERQKR